MKGKTDILIIADEPPPLIAGLQEAGFCVFYSSPVLVSGINFREFCLTVMLAEKDYPVKYFDACGAIRRQSNIPIVVVGNPENCIVFLELGADRFMGEFSGTKTAMALIQSVHRRLGSSWREADEIILEIETDKFAFSREKHEVRADGKLVHLQPREFKFLTCLLQSDGKVVYYQDIIDQVWGEDWPLESNVLRPVLRKVRKKLGKAVQIITVQSIGLRLTIPK